MDYQQILELVKEVSKAGLTNFEYTEGNIRIAMSCPQPEEKIRCASFKHCVTGSHWCQRKQREWCKYSRNRGSCSTVTGSRSSRGKMGGNLVKSPLVGTFYTAPSEDAEPFIKVGDTVKKGQTLAIVEAMKLMNEIESEFDGVVTEILVENEENVEYGQPLFRIQ